MHLQIKFCYLAFMLLMLVQAILSIPVEIKNEAKECEKDSNCQIPTAKPKNGDSEPLQKNHADSNTNSIELQAELEEIEKFKPKSDDVTPSSTNLVETIPVETKNEAKECAKDSNCQIPTAKPKNGDAEPLQKNHADSNRNSIKLQAKLEKIEKLKPKSDDVTPSSTNLVETKKLLEDLSEIAPTDELTDITAKTDDGLHQEIPAESNKKSIETQTELQENEKVKPKSDVDVPSSPKLLETEKSLEELSKIAPTEELTDITAKTDDGTDQENPAESNKKSTETQTELQEKEKVKPKSDDDVPPSTNLLETEKPLKELPEIAPKEELTDVKPKSDADVPSSTILQETEKSLEELSEIAPTEELTDITAKTDDGTLQKTPAESNKKSTETQTELQENEKVKPKSDLEISSSTTLLETEKSLEELAPTEELTDITAKTDDEPHQENPAESNKKSTETQTELQENEKVKPRNDADVPSSPKLLESDKSLEDLSKIAPTEELTDITAKTDDGTLQKTPAESNKKSTETQTELQENEKVKPKSDDDVPSPTNLIETKKPLEELPEIAPKEKLIETEKPLEELPEITPKEELTDVKPKSDKEAASHTNLKQKGNTSVGTLLEATVQELMNVKPEIDDELLNAKPKSENDVLSPSQTNFEKNKLPFKEILTKLFGQKLTDVKPKSDDDVKPYKNTAATVNNLDEGLVNLFARNFPSHINPGENKETSEETLLEAPRQELANAMDESDDELLDEDDVPSPINLGDNLMTFEESLTKLLGLKLTDVQSKNDDDDDVQPNKNAVVPKNKLGELYERLFGQNSPLDTNPSENKMTFEELLTKSDSIYDDEEPHKNAVVPKNKLGELYERLFGQNLLSHMNNGEELLANTPKHDLTAVMPKNDDVPTNKNPAVPKNELEELFGENLSDSNSGSDETQSPIEINNNIDLLPIIPKEELTDDKPKLHLFIFSNRKNSIPVDNELQNQFNIKPAYSENSVDANQNHMPDLTYDPLKHELFKPEATDIKPDHDHGNSNENLIPILYELVENPDQQYDDDMMYY